MHRYCRLSIGKLALGRPQFGPQTPRPVTITAGQGAANLRAKRLDLALKRLQMLSHDTDTTASSKFLQIPVSANICGPSVGRSG